MKARGVGLITVFGLGAMRPFPGTWGSLPPVIVAALLALSVPVEARGWVLAGAMLALLLVFSGACVVQGDAAEARFGRKDPSNAVADEVAGQSLVFLLLPHAALATPARAAATLFAGFVLFRVLDILKPPPARQLQRVPAGWGILLDDLAAGAYAWGVLQILTRLAFQPVG